ncbi:MAG: class I SAM-dependent methyltransferase [Pseudomonadota bacterium]|nr:class I SAM-dependent methyltransferase [Pseudomonadota bacterium]
MKKLLRSIRAILRWFLLWTEAKLKHFLYRSKPEKIVSKGYDKMAADYGQWTLNHKRPDREKYTKLLIDRVANGSRVLELGCGPGDPTTKKLAEYYDVTANDISESCLALARKNAPNAKFILADMTEIDFEGEYFDAIVSYYAFHHIPRDRYKPLLGKIHKWLKPNGYFMAAMYPYDVENLITENWHGSTMYWSSYNKEETIDLIESMNFKILNKSMESAIEDNKETTFLWVFAEKHST